MLPVRRLRKALAREDRRSRARGQDHHCSTRWHQRSGRSVEPPRRGTWSSYTFKVPRKLSDATQSKIRHDAAIPGITAVEVAEMNDVSLSSVYRYADVDFDSHGRAIQKAPDPVIGEIVPDEPAEFPEGHRVFRRIQERCFKVLLKGLFRLFRNVQDRDTEEFSLIEIRRGQAEFKRHIAQFERGCRITGVSQPEFLIASHIKPWDKADDRERIDGNNGLLLSPHIDKLFDRGWMTFADDGSPIYSNNLPAEILELWSIKSDLDHQPFNPQQVAYLQYHREFVFRDDA